MDPAMTKMIACGALGLVAGLGIGIAIGRGGSKKPAAKKPQQKKDREIRKTHPAPADGSVEIYVGNLSYDMTEPQLLAEFEKFGKVNSARIITNRANGRSKGFAFVIMPDRDEAEKAINALSEKEIMGRPMKVNEARNLDKQVLNKD